MKILTADFMHSAPDLASCKFAVLPEFGFIGRSNVGKSSLINLLASRKSLARVSGTPGKTRLMNFFKINSAWMLVDLPGYGYARVGKEQRADFNAAVADYIQNRENLKLMFVLIDSRLEAQDIDRDFIDWMDGRIVPYAIVFTKADKLSANQLRASVDRFNKAVFAGRATLPPQFISSVETGQGRNEILGLVAQYVAAGRKK